MRSRFAWKIGMLGSMAVAIVVAAATVMRPVPAQALPIAPASQARTSGAHWTTTVPLLSGSVVHWSESLYSFETGAEDPANGHMLVGEIWEAIGRDGQPTAYHALYTYQNGTFHQEVYQTKTTILIILGRDYAKTQPTLPGHALPSGWCIKSGNVPSSAITANLPLFANETELAQIGASVRDGIPTEALPNTPLFANAQPSKVYDSSPRVRIWSTSTVDTRAHTTRTLGLELGVEGRVLIRHVHDTGAQGQVIEDTWTANGPLLAYTSGSIPPSVFTMPQQVSGGCDR